MFFGFFAFFFCEKTLGLSHFRTSQKNEYNFSKSENFLDTTSIDFGMVLDFIDATSLLGSMSRSRVEVGDLVMMVSKNLNERSLGIFEVSRIMYSEDFESRDIVVLKLKKGSNAGLIRPGDYFFKIDLEDFDKHYAGNTDLLVRGDKKFISSRYKFLVTQGNAIGDTAETLWQFESLITVSRLWDDSRLLSSVVYNYGITDRWSFGARLSAFEKTPNFTVKTKFYEGAVNTVATGLTVQKIESENAATININLMWDSISSETTISHTFLSIALRNDQLTEESSVVKSIGTSNVQTGYEFVLKNWTRILVGPNYNVEKKILGGYLSWVKIWNNFHLQVGVNTTNFQSLKLRSDDGYSPFVEGYFRF